MTKRRQRSKIHQLKNKPPVSNRGSFSLKVQKRIWNEVRLAAGPRYTAEINVELPIKELFEGLAKTDRFFSEIKALQKDYTERFRSVSRKNTRKYKDKNIRKNLIIIKTYGKKYARIVDRLGQKLDKILNLRAIEMGAKKILKHFYPIDKVIREIEQEEDDEQRKKAKEEGREYLGHSPSEKLRNLKDLQYDLNKLYSVTRDIEHFSRSYKAKLANEPILLILGQAGMGKTHLVCDVTKERIERKLPPTVIVLGEKLLEIQDPLDAIFNVCSLGGNKIKILRELNKIGKDKKTRALIIVDAINEADREGWRRNVGKLIKEIKQYPWVGLVMTCRIPFEHLSLPKRLKIITDYHKGFEDNELEAMTAFFNFYGIPLPEVPLLVSEFSSPLFLSCFCKTAQNIKGGKAKVAKDVRDLALGQVGMTKILEDFYITKEREIVKKHNAAFSSLIKQSWIWNKGSHNCLIKIIAERMANSGNRYVKEADVINSLKQLSDNKYSNKNYSKILNILIEEGVIVKDAAWDDQKKQYFDVIKFSFHKFSDHIIARYLLDNFFDRNKVKQSLQNQNSLGNLFYDERSVLSNIDLIEALMVEFPERIKKNKKLQERDLVDFLPKSVRKTYQVRSAFLESLYWRRPENFLNSQGHIKKTIINYINKVLLRHRDSSKELLDLFVSTATKPFHPLSAKMFNNYLFGFSISSRDLFWSEYLRKQYGSGSVYKLISWIENQNLTKITPEQAWCVITVLGWTLTTNVRLLRNRATRCIYLVGKVRPNPCFRTTLEMLKTNDPYIIERMLAASYGISMALIHDRSNKEFLKVFYSFTKKIYAAFFKNDAPYGTTNVCIRDYARGILELALVKNKRFLSEKQIKRIRPLYHDGGIRRWGRSKDRNKGEYRDGNAPFGMDFENYTLGHLVTGRGNYDFKNKEFIKVKENVLWRIYQLGYSLDKFGGIDKEIVSNTRLDRRPDYAGKVDRYGKKYCWIAYYELLGFRMDKRLIERYYSSEDGRDGDFDLDPSFPQIPERKPLIVQNLTKGPKDIKKWLVQSNAPDISKYLQIKKMDGVKGPWILVHGIIEEENKKLSRKITTFITGILLKKENEGRLKEFLLKTPFPGNDNIPSLRESPYLFTGELGWRERINLKRDDHGYLRIYRGDKKVKLSKREKRFYNIRIILDGLDIKQNTAEPPQYRTESIYEKVPVRLLARWFSSKDYSRLGRDDDGAGMYVPSKEIMIGYKLYYKPASFIFLNSESQPVSISFVRGDQYGTHENLLYLRKDLIDKIVKKSGKRFYLLTWGERRYWPENLSEVHREDLSPIYQAYNNIYKKLFPY